MKTIISIILAVLAAIIAVLAVLPLKLAGYIADGVWRIKGE